ncbi:hypothetical protein VNI00_015141 [Paramarasmius palmivorus]|uniref:Uncharacterized protein n=1 Tax=Paramarasmius palmivorus TaxID=297713 RepID=A0AAW0BPE2_9AGAR
MLWFLLLLLSVQVSSQQYHKIIIEDVQTTWAPAAAISLNITWNFNDGEHKPNEKPLFALVQASDEPLVFNATEACELAAPCLPLFTLPPSISGELKFHLQAHLENGSEDFDDRQIAVNVTGSIVNVSVVPSSSSTPTMSSTTLSSPTTTHAASHDANPNKSTIIGAVVGSVIAFVIASFCLCRHRRRFNRHKGKEQTRAITPYPTDVQVREKLGLRQRKEQHHPSDTYNQISVSQSPVQPTMEAQAPKADPDTVQATEEPPPPITSLQQPRLRRHEDSGWRPRHLHVPPSEYGGSNFIDVPPEYENAL